MAYINLTDHAVSLPEQQQQWQPLVSSSGFLLRVLRPLPVLVRSIFSSPAKRPKTCLRNEC